MVGYGRRLGRWRETLLGRFKEMAVVVGVVWVSLASQIFNFIGGFFLKEIIFNMLGGGEACLKPRILGGYTGGVFV